MANDRVSHMTTPLALTPRHECASKNSSSTVSLLSLLFLCSPAYRVQILPQPHPDQRLGPVLQRHHRPQWLGQIQHSRRDMFRARYHQRLCGLLLLICDASHSLIRALQMRAQTQQDLIYKRGQAGITKASVTIVFDNTDTQNKDQMPAGFANQPQITVTRQVSHLFVCVHFVSFNDTP